MTLPDRTGMQPAAPAVPITQTTAVEMSRAVAEVAAAVRVAQEVPRDVRRAFAAMREACGRLSFAERSFYRVTNRGTGPSVHLARELIRIWGNADYGVHELSRDDEAGYSEVRAYAWDQETNVRASRTFQVPHVRMAGGQRKPLTDDVDVYLKNQNVGARAVRETILAVLPRDFVDDAIEVCRATLKSGGDGAPPLLDRIDALVRRFGDLGVTVPQLERKLGGRKRGQWTPVDVADLTIVGRSISAGETTVEEEFPDPVLTAESLTGAPPASDPHGAPPGSGARAQAAAEQLPTVGDWPTPATPGGGDPA